MADDDVLDVPDDDLRDEIRDEIRKQVKSMFTSRQVDVSDCLAADEFLLMEGGRMAVKLCMVKGQPQLAFIDAQGTIRLQIGFSHIGEPAITLNDPQGRGRAMLGLTKDNQPHLYFIDETGKTFFSAP